MGTIKWGALALRRVVLMASGLVGALAPAAALATLAAPGGPGGPGDDLLDRQRAAFMEIYPQVEQGDWSGAAGHAALLKSYPLWPDLRAVYLRARMGAVDDAEIGRFLAEHSAGSAVRSLRYRYALHLAATGEHRAFLDLYRASYQGRDAARLDCLALQAQIALGQSAEVVERGRGLWLVGRSQVDECDPVFDHLRATGQLGAAEYRQRFELAVAAGNYRLAAYLARSLGQADRDEAAAWQRAYARPEAFLLAHTGQDDSEVTRRQLIRALQRIAYPDPARAHELWQGLGDSYAFSAEQRADVSRYIALWAARRQLPEADGWLRGLPDAAVDAEVRSWRVRAALRRQDWRSVSGTIASMPPAEQQEEQWSFWRAQAALAGGHKDRARGDFERLARERSYYGFLAADALARPYVFRHVPLQSDPALARSLLEQPALLRARELHSVGLDAQGRAEWDQAVRALPHAQKLQAALLAHEWGWHSRAIATAGMAKHYDDLQLRYPLPYRHTFERFAADARISDSWAYGIARSESLFIPDIRSGAGAVGLMQLMPATGKLTAKSLRVPYTGVATLIDPPSNIQLGTTYLGKMYTRFGASQVLATAAYNAGPHRVQAWLPEGDGMDARIWIENIPFNETRKYVRRVLEADTIFHWRMTGQTRRVSQQLASVGPVDQATRLARGD